MSDQDELLDIKQAAQFLGVSETSLRRWTNAGLLACLRVGRRRERRFRRADLLDFLEKGEAGSPPLRRQPPSFRPARGVGGFLLMGGTFFGTFRTGAGC